MGGQPPPAPQEANLQAAISAGVKTAPKQAADLWHALEGPKFFIARVGFKMEEVITCPLLLLALDEVAFVSEAVTKQLRALSEFAVEEFYPPLPAGQAPVGMPAQVQIATFVAAVLATLEYAMEGAQVCVQKPGSHLARGARATTKDGGGISTPSLHNTIEPQRQGSRGSSHSHERRL